MKILLPLLVAVPSLVTASPSLEWDWQLSARSMHYQHSALFPEPSRSNSQALDALLDVQVNWGEFTGLFAVLGSNVLTNATTTERSFANSQQAYRRTSNVEPDGQLIVQELFWQGSYDLAAFPLDISLGKVRLDWGVGYGYRPLDLFKPYRRNPVGIQVEEGVLLGMASHFNAKGEWSVLYTDSHFTQQQVSELAEQSQQRGLGLRHYHFDDDAEWQVIAYYDDQRRGLLGGSWLSVVNEAWEWHSSGVYQQQYWHYQQRRLYQPVTLEKAKYAWQVLLGLTWANSHGHSIIAEYWHDSRSWSAQQWQQAMQRAEYLGQSSLTQGLAYSYANGLNHFNLMQHNVMLHWAYDPQFSHSHNRFLRQLAPSLDLMLAPADGGVIATQWVSYPVLDTGDAAVDVELAGRFFSGASDSVYANLAESYRLIFNLKGKF